MPITRTNMIDDDGSGTTGTIFNNAWKQELYNQIDATVATTGGTEWKTMAGLTYTTDGGQAVAANVLINRYRSLGNNTVAWELGMNPVQPSVATASIYISTMPFGLLGPNNATYPIAWSSSPAYALFAGGPLALRRSDGQAWGTAGIWIFFSILLEASGG